MDAPQRAFALAFAAVAVLSTMAPLAVAPASASTPPDAICPVCGPSLDAAGHDADVDVKATHSTVQMHVGADGDATVTARVELTRSSARSLRENETAFDRLVDAAFEDHRRIVGIEHARAVSAELRDDDLVVEWTIPDAAREAAGETLLVTLFGESRQGLVLHADQLAMYGPDGWNVTNHPRTGEVGELATFGDDRTGERVVWRSDTQYDAQASLEDGTYVAFAPSEGAFARANAELAVATVIGPTMLGDALEAGGPGAVVLALAVGVCLFVLEGSSRPERESRLLAGFAGVVTVGGLAYALGFGYGPIPERNLELLALPAGIAIFGLLSARAPAVANLREAALRVTATVGVGGLGTVAFSTSFVTAFAATATVAVAGFYLVGVYDGRVGWPVAAVTAIVVATPVLAVLPSTPIGGFGAGFVGFVLTPIAFFAALLGVVTYRIGAGKDVTGERVVESRTTT